MIGRWDSKQVDCVSEPTWITFIDLKIQFSKLGNCQRRVPKPGGRYHRDNQTELCQMVQQGGYASIPSSSFHH